jgi:hypothetical protein
MLKRLEGILGRETLLARMDGYFASDDHWYAEQRHDLDIFVAKINSVKPRVLESAITQGEILHELAKAVRIADGPGRLLEQGSYITWDGTHATLTTVWAVRMVPFHGAMEQALSELIPQATLDITTGAAA